MSVGCAVTGNPRHGYRNHVEHTAPRHLRHRSPGVDSPQPSPTAPSYRTHKDFATMDYITVAVGSSIGLHARPANIIAETVQAAGVPVTLSVLGGEPVDADSALMIMTLAAGKGTMVIVRSDHQPTLEKIAELVASDLDAH
jgi:phosphocarrier protein HPr